ncbi:MAG: sialate O-acetylesterase [Akkermansiaceae bacterium]|nr:sialate O-acetylesterase [Akkermansiaceae bacterium]MCF7732077.1 sialate O-acetylesterase [Akkermansiaceae bacterium]
MLWYQGESNGDDDVNIYLPKLRALITGWRKVRQQGDFPVASSNSSRSPRPIRLHREA